MTTTATPGVGPADLARQILEHQGPAYNLSFMPFLTTTYRHGLSPGRPACKAYLQGHCPLGSACPDKHSAQASTAAPTTAPTYGYGSTICKHWLRGLCKKGESCEFLHEYNVRRMPECEELRRFGFCPHQGKRVVRAAASFFGGPFSSLPFPSSSSFSAVDLQARVIMPQFSGHLADQGLLAAF